MAETVNISKMAGIISVEIFKIFKWERVDLEDLNFQCEYPTQHGGTDKTEYTHPVDVVFYYTDPYTNKRVFFNTDLKSYKSSSINSGTVRTALVSLANTIDCAAMSEEWKEKYDTKWSSGFEVRGLLFIYNHDQGFDRDFYEFFERGQKESDKDKRRKYINPLSLNVQKNQCVHLIDPGLIEYLLNIVADIKTLKGEDKFPKKDYAFYYPDLILHKAKNESFDRPATIESLSGPFLIIKHPEVKVYDEKKEQLQEVYPKGYLIYLRSVGSDHKYFMYLFDQLSNYQVLEDDHIIRIRMPHNSLSSARSNFKRAIESYSKAWGYDSYKKDLLERIELDFVDSFTPTVFEQELARSES
tara:strand:- start:3350 stop:4417 length:1068 start_codon:yes stop_codon:yes gene_type:complete